MPTDYFGVARPAAMAAALKLAEATIKSLVEGAVGRRSVSLGLEFDCSLKEPRYETLGVRGSKASNVPSSVSMGAGLLT